MGSVMPRPRKWATLAVVAAIAASGCATSGRESNNGGLEDTEDIDGSGCTGGYSAGLARSDARFFGNKPTYKLGQVNDMIAANNTVIAEVQVDAPVALPRIIYTDGQAEEPANGNFMKFHVHLTMRQDYDNVAFDWDIFPSDFHTEYRTTSKVQGIDGKGNPSKGDTFDGYLVFDMPETCHGFLYVVPFLSRVGGKVPF